MRIAPSSFTIADYLGRTFDCACGHRHETALREVIIRSGALFDVPAHVRRLGCAKPLLVCDTNTWHAAGGRLAAVFAQAAMPHALHVFPETALVPDDAAVARIIDSLTPDCDLLIGVGAGTINDLGKLAAARAGCPYCIVGTAPSMDGFASNVAALMRDNLKTTLATCVPAAVVGDVDVLAAAPMDMLLAGLGDILGKHTCLLDWRISRLVCGEYGCDAIADMVARAVQTVSCNAQGVRHREPAAIAALMEALVLSGIAMSFAGNSRPASGCEHHLSHFWEMRFLFEGRAPVLHGRKVAVGTVVAALLYHKLAEEPVDFAAATRMRSAFDAQGWAADMRRCYGPAAPGVIALEAATHKNSPETSLPRIGAMARHWPAIVALIREMPTAQALASMLSPLGAPSTPAEIGVERQLLIEGVIAAKELRDRFTLWQMLWDLGLLQPYAAWAASHFDEREA